MHVCLIAEGSYPYITGGVGKWTHDLISSLPEVQFTVVSLWPTDRPEPQPLNTLVGWHHAIIAQCQAQLSRSGSNVTRWSSSNPPGHEGSAPPDRLRRSSGPG